MHITRRFVLKLLAVLPWLRGSSLLRAADASTAQPFGTKYPNLDSLATGELYNLKADPQEKNILAATNKRLVNELGAALRQHIQRGGATPWQTPLSK